MSAKTASDNAGADPTLEALVAQSRAGDRTALDGVVAAIRDRVFNLAVRMLWHPADAEDATQEILIRIIANLGSYRGESAFTTWAYRVAANYLLTTRKRRAEREELTFERFAEQLDQGLAEEPYSLADRVETKLLVEEMKIGCTQGMLLCLDRDHRLAYILGHVFGLTSHEAAEIVGTSPATFRKRLSRARGRLHAFMERKCGLVDPANPCRCALRIEHAVETGRIEPASLLFAGRPRPPGDEERTRVAAREMEQLHSAAELLRGHPRYAAPDATADVVRRVLQDSRLTVLAE